MTEADHHEELIVAERVRAAARDHLGRDLGAPVLHDDGSESQMFDVLFPSPTPPIAMEVTSISDSDFLATAGTSWKVANRATDAAERNEAGSWLIEIARESRLRPQIEEWVMAVIEGELSPQPYPSGVVRLRHWKGPPHQVHFATWSSMSALSPLSIGDIEERIEAKRSVLGRAKGHERHLAVAVRRLHSRDLPLPPDLSEEIDTLWLLWWDGLIFWVDRGGEQWQATRYPWA